MQTPENIRVNRGEGLLELIWNNSDTSLIPLQLVRQSCPCAACVDEFTGKQILDPDSVPADIVPQDVALAGNYALKVSWSDGHDTGLFTWTYLRSIAEQLP